MDSEIINVISVNQTKFGKHLRPLFFIGNDFINVNNGSFGTPPREIVQKQREVQELFESNPDKFIRFEMTDKINESKEAIGKYVNADPNDLVLMENSSEALNSVFRSLLTKKGEKVL